MGEAGGRQAVTRFMDLVDPSPSPEEMKALVKAARRQQTMAGLLVAVLFHAGLVVVLTMLVLPLVRESPPQLIISAVPTPPPETQVKRTLSQFHSPQKPSPASSAAAKVITASAVSPVAVPVIDEPVETAVLGVDLGEGVGFGAGLGLGGAGAGLGTVSFFGNEAEGEHVVFVVDVSASMSGEQFQLMKGELTRSLEGLQPGSKYQVIFFSGPVWFAGQKIERESRTRSIVSGHRGRKLVWESDGRADGFVFADGKQPMPVEPWRHVSPSSIRQTKREVAAVQKSFGTSWEQPLSMALSMDPKPDVIYFMTDGAVRDAATAVQEISRMNRRGGKKAKIFTTAMMEPKAAAQLDELAKKNGGTFSKVLQDGSVVTGRDALR